MTNQTEDTAGKENSAQESQPGDGVSATSSAPSKVNLNGLYMTKVGMTSIFVDGVATPVTVLKYNPLVVSQLRSSGDEDFIQLAGRPTPLKAERKSRRRGSNRALAGHLKKAGFEGGAKIIHEIRQKSGLSQAQVGAPVSQGSFSRGDTVQVTAKSKGRGFAGVVKRHGFAGGPASHGSGFKRAPGSMGCRTWPGQVMPGKRLPGQFGNASVTVKNLRVVEVDLDESVVLVSGAVPGARNSLVKVLKVNRG